MFYENFERLCSLRGTSPFAVTQKIGLSKSTAAGWKKNGTIPKQKVLDKLASHLDCEVADFFRDKSGTVQGPLLSSVMTYCRDREMEMDENGTLHLPGNEFSEPLLPESEVASNLMPAQEKYEDVDLKEAMEDFVRVYRACPDRKTRTRLMAVVYDFEDMLDATYGEDARNAEYEALEDAAREGNE